MREYSLLILSEFSTNCLSQAEILVARVPKDFWCAVREVVQRVKISSRDLEARRDVLGGGGPVREAPRAGLLPASIFCTPKALLCAVEFDAPLAVAGVEDGAVDEEVAASLLAPPGAPNRLGAAADVEAGAAVLATSLLAPTSPPNKLGAVVEVVAGAGVAAAALFPPRPPKRPDVAVAAGLEAASLFAPPRPENRPSEGADVGAGAAG